MSNPNQTRAENRYLAISATGNLVMAGVGLTFAVISRSQAILLDGVFDLTYFATALLTLRVAHLVQQEDDEHFPLGYGFHEPLVNGLKGVLVLGVSVMALIGSIQAIAAGGRDIVAGVAIAYGILATVGSWVLAGIVRRGSRRTDSPLLHADAENWIVNGAISSCVVLAFASILILRRTSLGFLVPYVDPAVVLSVVLISIAVPVRMARRALMQLLNRTPSLEIAAQVRESIEPCLTELPVEELFVRVVQPGRTRFVLAHVVLAEGYSGDGLRAFDVVRANALRRLREDHRITVLDMVFTGDRKWGAPGPATEPDV